MVSKLSWTFFYLKLTHPYWDMDSLDLTTSAQTLYEGKTGTSQAVTLSKFMLSTTPPAPILKYKHITGRAMILLFRTLVANGKEIHSDMVS